MPVSQGQGRARATLAIGCLDTLLTYIKTIAQNTLDRLISRAACHVETPSVTSEIFHHQSQSLLQTGSTPSYVSTWLHIDPPGIVGIIHRGNQFGIARAQPSSNERRNPVWARHLLGGNFSASKLSDCPRNVLGTIAIWPLCMDDVERSMSTG